jgi:hypothetical protein
MILKTPIPFISFTAKYLILVILMSACVSVVTPEKQTAPITPTPEIFIGLAPSPAPPDSSLPLTCQVTDLGVYVNEEWGYCFAYPGTFTPDASRAAEGVITLSGPTLEDSTDPVRASLEITAQPVPKGSNFTRLVDAYLISFRELSAPILREPGMLGGQYAEILEPVPGLLSSRVMIALHNDILFTLRFHPSDLEITKADLDALEQTVTGSFAFLPQTSNPVSQLQTVSWYEFGKDISLSYNSILAPWADAWTVPAVPVDDEIMFAEAHPQYAQIRFLGFQGGRAYDLPLLPIEDRMAQVRVFRTADFPGFGDDSPNGFVNQMQALKDLMETGLDPARCAQPLAGKPGLPYLPWINMQQTFCAQPQVVEFSGGKGIRYLTYYSQGPNPVVDQQVFYTFQGLTGDEQFYVAGFFPVETGIFPAEPLACTQCADPNYDPLAEWNALLADQLTQLNAQPEYEFAPSLRLLDELIKSIYVGK